MAAAAEAGGGGSSRHEKSLGLLTTKFVSLLQEAKDGVLDLKAVRGGRAAPCCRGSGAPRRALGARRSRVLGWHSRGAGAPSPLLGS